jgi:hypothetical protein
LGALVRANLCLGEVERACPLLARLLTLRNAQNIRTRFAVQRLRGDVHLACAREAAGMAPADDSRYRESPIPRRLTRHTEVRAALNNARRAYTAALQEGRVVDDKLVCHGHQENIAERLNRVAAIATRLDQ